MKKQLYMAMLLPMVATPVIVAVSCGGAKAAGASQSQVVKVNDEDFKVIQSQIGDIQNVQDKLAVGERKVDDENARRSKIGQAFSMHGHSDQMLSWKTDMYEDSAFNMPLWSPIKHSFRGEAYKKTQARNGSKLTLLDNLNDKTAGTPISGIKMEDNKSNAFDFWQYIDTLVAWGGSASEGTWQTPSADWINAAHKNGVKILGTIFFAPPAFGGSIEEVEKVFTKVDGKYPYADNLVAMAKHYGFDGWFWNIETPLTSEGTAKLAEFANYLGKVSRENNIIHQLYGSVPSYNAIDSSNWPIMFNGEENKLNFEEYLADYRIKTSVDSLKILRDNHQADSTFSKGIEFEGPGFGAAGAVMTAYDDNVQTYAGPNQNSMWIFTTNKNIGRDESKKERFWSSSAASRDVRYNFVTDAREETVETFGDFPSMSNFFVENSIIDGRSNFSTSFNDGIGQVFYEKGNLLPMIDEDGYTSLSTQDYMPSYRWMIDVTDANDQVQTKTPWVNNKIVGSIKDASATDGAFHGSNYLTYKGNLEVNEKFTNKLFASKFEAKASDSFNITYQGNIKPKIVLWQADGAKTELYPQSGEDVNGWKTITANFGDALAGKKIVSWGLQFKNETGATLDTTSIKVGKIDLNLNSEEQAIDVQAHQLQVEKFALEKSGNSFLRLKIDQISDVDKVKYIKASVWDGSQYVLNSFSGSHGLWLHDLKEDFKAEVNGNKYYKVKITYYGKDDEEISNQNLLIE